MKNGFVCADTYVCQKTGPCYESTFYIHGVKTGIYFRNNICDFLGKKLPSNVDYQIRSISKTYLKILFFFPRGADEQKAEDTVNFVVSELALYLESQPKEKP